jgi:hypothetical protein
MVNNIEEIISHSMAFIEDDFTELWVIVSKVQEENPKLNFEEIIEATKEVVRELVIKNNVKVLDENTQEPMNLSLNEILKLVEDKFKTLSKIPNIGDGIWLTI